MFRYFGCMLIMAAIATGCKKEGPAGPMLPQHIAIALPFDKNPSGNWQVGYSVGTSLDTAGFRLMTYADTSHIIALWHPASGQAAYYPYAGQNRNDTATELEPTNGWSARAGEIVMEGSNSGQYGIVRFIAPATGSYHLKAIFEGVHFALSSTDVHILHNNIPMFEDEIEGYGGDATFHAVEGAHPVAVYEGSLELKQGDILSFAVGYGANKNHYYDTTGLLLTLQRTK